MTVTAAMSVAVGTNHVQRLPRADLAPRLCCARALHSVTRTLSLRKRVPGCEGSADLL